MWSVADLDDDLAAGVAAGDGGEAVGGAGEREDGFDVDGEGAVQDLGGQIASPAEARAIVGLPARATKKKRGRKSG